LHPGARRDGNALPGSRSWIENDLAGRAWRKHNFRGDAMVFARSGLALSSWSAPAKCLALLAEGQECDARRSALTTIRQRQFKAILNPARRLEIARKIVAAKFRKLKLTTSEMVEFREEIRKARSIENLLVADERPRFTSCVGEGSK
jgi:hypothetical protein